MIPFPADLVDDLRDAGRHGPVWFYPHAGNAGDALIVSAAWRLFAAAGVEARLVPERGFDATGRTVVVGGGGNLVPYYDQVARFLERHAPVARRIVVLPHTIQGHEGLLGSLDGRTTLWCRELASLEHCRRHAPGCRLEISHDLALALDPGDFPPPAIPGLGFLGVLARILARRVVGRKELPSGGLALRAWKWHRASRVVPGTPVLNAFRTDAEAPGASVPDGNVDLSELLRLGVRSRADADFTTALLFDAVRAPALVRTDRLHVCIAAALLGKDVEFRQGGTTKCADVWNHSLRARYPSIRWRGAEDAP